MNPIRNKKNLDETIKEIRNFANLYLEKYSPSKQQLKTYLLKKTIKKLYYTRDIKDLGRLIDIVVNDIENKEFINDKFYSNAKAKIFFRRGYSLNKIRQNLIKKGIEEKFIKGSILKIKDEEIDPDFFSAIKVCKKKRIGPARPEPNRELFYKKDISYLARAGFDYDTSKKILNLTKEEFLKLHRLI